MIDLYALPRDFPEHERCYRHDSAARRVECLEQAMGEAIGDRRLIPYVQKHEFEALVFASLDALEERVPCAARVGLVELRKVMRSCGPEDVDDGENTAPSKRLQAHIPRYNKLQHGIPAIRSTDLPALRGACPHFDAWINDLEQLAG